jgi:hypothetical protein
VTDLVDVLSQEFVLVEDVSIAQLDVTEEVTVAVTDETTILISEASQGPPGIQGPRGEPGGQLDEKTAARDLSGHRVVLLDAQGRADYVSAAVLGHAGRAFGLTVGAAVLGGPATIQTYGSVTEPSWSWDVNKPVYLGADGALTQVAPTAPQSKFSTVVGLPIASTTLFVSIGIPIVIA